MSWLRPTWDIIRTSLWLVPSLLCLVGVALAVIMVSIDHQLAGRLDQDAWWLHTGDGEDARTLLSTLLASIITMASMAFSVTVVALTLAATTFGSRLVRVFRADLRTQAVLGIFLMTIVYCLLVLYTLRGSATAEEVPQLSVSLGTALALVSVVALLAFIQGVAHSIVADDVAAKVGREFERGVAVLPPAGPEAGEPRRGDVAPDGDFEAVALPREGYVQSVDYDGMLAWAERKGALLLLDFRAGDFVVDGEERIRVSPPTGRPDTVRRDLDRFIVSGNERTPTQDLEFAVRHLVEIAVRALSPGVNDPFSAVAVIDRIRGSMSKLMGRALPDTEVRGSDGALRILRKTSTFGGTLDAALHQIRQSGANKPAVLIHLLRALQHMAGFARTSEHVDELTRHVGLVRAAAHRDVADRSDLQDIEAAFEAAMAALHSAGEKIRGR